MTTKEAERPGHIKCIVSGFYRLCTAVEQFCIEVVEWRRPFVSSLYLLAVNGAFWAGVFYLDRNQQYTALVSLVATLVFLDTIQRLVLTIGPAKEATYQTLNNVQEFREQSFMQKLRSFLWFIVTLTPIRLILKPPLLYFLSWITEKPIQLLIVGLSSTAAHSLEENAQERACWLSYCTVLAVLVVPAWQYNQITQQITASLKSAAHFSTEFIHRSILSPTYRFLCIVGRTLQYYLLLRWVPPLWLRIKTALVNFKSSVSTRVVEPTLKFGGQVLSFLKYYCLGYWIPPLLRRLKDWLTDCWLNFRQKCLVPVGNCFIAIWNGFLYIVLGRYIPPLYDWCKLKILNPIHHLLTQAKDKTSTLIIRAKDKLFFYLKRLKDALVYVIFCYWLLDLFRFIKRFAVALTNYARIQWIGPFSDWLINLPFRINSYIKETIIYPTVTSVKNTYRRSVLFVKTKIIKPIIESIYVATYDLMVLVYNNVINPFWLYFEVILRRFKHYALVQWLEPGFEWVRERLPDKSAFVEDSDTELRDFLPAELSRQSSPVDSETDEHGLTPSLGPSTTASRHISRQSSEEEEQNFVEGLSFPSHVRDSDSSDDEFSLRQRYSGRRSLRRRNNVAVKQEQNQHNQNIPEEVELTLSNKINTKVVEEKKVESESNNEKEKEEAMMTDEHENKENTPEMSMTSEGENSVVDQPTSEPKPKGWSDTLLRAYKMASRKTTPFKIHPKRSLTPETARKDDDFEILDPKELEQ